MNRICHTVHRWFRRANISSTFSIDSPRDLRLPTWVGMVSSRKLSEQDHRSGVVLEMSSRKQWLSTCQSRTRQEPYIHTDLYWNENKTSHIRSAVLICWNSLSPVILPISVGMIPEMMLVSKSMISVVSRACTNRMVRKEIQLVLPAISLVDRYNDTLGMRRKHNATFPPHHRGHTIPTWRTTHLV